jgi:hypothetical protein
MKYDKLSAISFRATTLCLSKFDGLDVVLRELCYISVIFTTTIKHVDKTVELG